MSRKTKRGTKVWDSNLTCVICGAIKVRLLYSSGKSECIGRFLVRKTCGKGTECYNKYISGKGNPNYKGYMPKCIICGKKISYNNAKDMKKGTIPQFCQKHYFESKIGIYPKHLIKPPKGLIPENLKQYLFIKGQTPWNKKSSLVNE